MNNSPAINTSTSPSELLAEIARLTAANEALKTKAKNTVKRGLSFKVSLKGAVSVYGMGRFPVTLYATQWTKLFGAATDIATFIEENKSKLAVKEDSAAIVPVSATQE